MGKNRKYMGWVRRETLLYQRLQWRVTKEEAMTSKDATQNVGDVELMNDFTVWEKAVQWGDCKGVMESWRNLV